LLAALNCTLNFDTYCFIVIQNC